MPAARPTIAVAALAAGVLLNCLSAHAVDHTTARVARDPRRAALESDGVAAHTDGTCCPAADVPSRHACRFMKPRDGLMHAPAPRPAEFGDACLLFERQYERHATPTFSVLVSGFNAAARLRILTTQLLKLTRGTWELIVLCDACTDGSLDVVRETLDRSKTWPACPYPEASINPAAVWQTGVNLTSHQGDIGRECWLETKGALTRAALIDVAGAELLETAANNVLLLAARAPYMILMQGDHLMTQPGWNVALTTPLTTWADVFSVSARCAHDFDYSQQGGGLTGAKCLSSLTPQPTDPARRCRFYVRDTGNRGPLAVRASYAHRVGYLDEVRFWGEAGNDEHDMNLRAYAGHGWVSGHAPIDYTEERCCRSAVTREDGGAAMDRYRHWLRERLASMKADPSLGAFGAPPHAFVQGGHDEVRAIESGAFWEGCGRVRR